MAVTPWLLYFKLWLCIPALLQAVEHVGIVNNKSQVYIHAWLKPRGFALQDPATKKPSILVSVQRVVHVEGMSWADSADLLDRVLREGADNSKVYRHQWQPDDFLIWANRKLRHLISHCRNMAGSRGQVTDVSSGHQGAASHCQGRVKSNTVFLWAPTVALHIRST